MMWGVAILTMVVGAIIAVTQTDVKRMLAYSSIAHAGFMLTGVIADQRRGHLARAVLPGRVRLHDDRRVRGGHAGARRGRRGDATCPAGPVWAGARRWSAAIFAFFLLAFAGIPLTSGFTGKFAVFKAAAAGGAAPLVIVGVVSSAIAAFFYIRVIVLMFFSEPKPDGPAVAVPAPLR